jgi:hypothetical protein
MVMTCDIYMQNILHRMKLYSTAYNFKLKLLPVYVTYDDRLPNICMSFSVKGMHIVCIVILWRPVSICCAVDRPPRVPSC